MEISLADKVVWITGGSEGIGRAIALLAAKCGASVAVTGRDEHSLQIVVDDIVAQGGTALSVPGDVTSMEAMQRATQQIVERFGGLHVLVANAGINGTWAPIESLSLAEWTDTIDINLTGTFLAIHNAVPHLKSAGGGSILIVSSINGTRVFTNQGATAYSTSKAGQLALGKMLAIELAPAKIRVNVICPGAIDTGIHEGTERRQLDELETLVEYPRGRIPLTGREMGRPEQVARLAVFLVSDAADHISGTPVWIDGAESLLE